MVSELFTEISSVLYQNRYCDQEDFDLIVSEVTSDKELKCYERKIHKVKYPSYTYFETIHSTLKYSISDIVLTSGSGVLITSIQGVEKSDTDGVRSSFEQYNLRSDLVNLPDKRVRYCACMFMKDMYVFGGNCDFKSLKTCLKYETSSNSWTNIADMKYRTESAACTVYEGKIVVFGFRKV